MSSGAERIAAERQRQIEEEGWSPEHDAGPEHANGELVAAAMAYLNADPHLWPWRSGWKPKNYVSDLTRAGALVAAEIDRVLSNSTKEGTSDER